MHKLIGITGLCGLMWAGAAMCLAAEGTAKKKILFFSQSEGFRHGMVCRPLTGEMAPAEQIFKDIATRAGYQVFFSQDFHDLGGKKDFKNYDAIIFYTSGDVKIDKDGLYEWVRDGGAFIGIHSATDTWKQDPKYIKFIGGAFKTHGQGNKEVTIKVEDTESPATRMLGKQWKLVDEIYHIVDFSRDNVHMLLSIDTTQTDLKPQKMEPGQYYPVAWTRTEGKGRVFYTSLGHRKEVWEDPKYQQHLLNGIAWALHAVNGGS